MKKFFKVFSTAAFATALLVGCGGGGAPATEESDQAAGATGGTTGTGEVLINIGSAPSSASWYTYFTAMANTINNNSDKVETAVVEAGGTVVNAINMANKQQDVGFTMSDIAYDSYHGLGQFDGTNNPGNPDLRLMWNIAPTAMHWAVSQESGITDFEGLNGQKFNPSSIGGGGEFITFRVFELLGIEPDFQRMQLEDAGEQVQNGQLVGFSYNGSVPIPKFTEVHSQKPLHILSLSEEQVETVLAEYPYFITSTIPADAYPGTEEATTLGLYTGVAANATLDEDIVYEMTKAYWENLDSVVQSFPLVESETIQNTIDTAPIPLHKGSIRYFEEQGFTIPDELKVD